MAETTKLVTELTGENKGLMAALQQAAKGVSDFADKSGKSFMGLENPLKDMGDKFKAF